MSVPVADEESEHVPIASREFFVPRSYTAHEKAESDARQAEMVAEHAAHAAACVATYCTRCGRYACVSCERAPVADYAERCSRCRLRDAVQQMQIPLRYRGALVHVATRVRSVAARDAAMKSLDAKAIVLEGGAGSGKTTLGAAMLIDLAHREIAAVTRRRPLRPMLFASAIDLGLARSQHRLGCGEAVVVTDAMRASVLVLDDLGAEGARDADVIAQVLHARHNADRATWITTGLSVAEVASRYGGGLERRIYEGALLIDCDGPPDGGPAGCGAR
jgi:DNA replication protein DnaC